MILLLAIVSLCLATWCATVRLALTNGNRTAIANRLGYDRQSVDARMTSAYEGCGLGSVVFQAAFLVLWIGEIATFDPTSVSAWLLWFAVGASTGAVILWIMTLLVATATARWAGPGFVSRQWSLVCVTAGPGAAVAGIACLIDEIVKRLSGANLKSNGRPGAEAEAELLRSIEAKQREGELDEGAATLLENVFDFTTTDVGEVMTPRTEIEGIELTDDLPSIRKFIVDAGHSRIPVYLEDLDHIAGILYVKDLVPYLGEDTTSFSLEPLLRRPIVIPQTKPVSDLLADFQRAEVHMAIVVDEYGGTAGLATIEDVLEEIVGEIYDEHEGEPEDEPKLIDRGDGTWEVDGRFHVDDLNEELEVELPEEAEYDTVGGWFTAVLGRVPTAGESVSECGLRVTVLEAAPTHVTRLHLERVIPLD